MTKQTLKNRLKGLARTAMKHEERVAAGLEQDNTAVPPVSWGSADAAGKTIAGSAKTLPENYQAAEHIVYGIDVLRQKEQAGAVADESICVATDIATGVNTYDNTIRDTNDHAAEVAADICVNTDVATDADTYVDTVENTHAIGVDTDGNTRRGAKEHAEGCTPGSADAGKSAHASAASPAAVDVSAQPLCAMNVGGGDGFQRGAQPVDAVYGMSGEEKRCATLSMQHRAVYEYLLRLPEPWMNTKMADIRNARGQAVPYDSKRGALVWLARAGFITQRAMRTSAGIKGVGFALSERLAQCFCRLHGLPLPAWLGQEPVLTHASTSVATQVSTQDAAQNTIPVWLGTLFRQHPEYMFWRKYSTLKDISQLYADTALPQDVFDQYLRWYAFSKGKTAVRGRHSALHDFTVRLLADEVHKPEGYLSHEEKALALAEELAREKAERLRRIRRLEEEQARMALSAAFDSMMTRGAADPLYKKVRGGLNAVLLDYEKSEPVLFAQAMRTAFMALFSGEGQGGGQSPACRSRS